MSRNNRQTYVVYVASNAEDGTLNLSVHGHYHSLARANTARGRIERALRDVPGGAQIGVTLVRPDTAWAAAESHIPEEEG